MVPFLKNHPFYTKLFAVLVLFNIFLHLEAVEKHFAPKKQISVAIQNDVCSTIGVIGKQDSQHSVLKIGILLSGISSSSTSITALHSSVFKLDIFPRTITINNENPIRLSLLSEHTSGLSPPTFKI